MQTGAHTAGQPPLGCCDFHFRRDTFPGVQESFVEVHYLIWIWLIALSRCASKCLSSAKKDVGCNICAALHVCRGPAEDTGDGLAGHKRSLGSERLSFKLPERSLIGTQPRLSAPSADAGARHDSQQVSIYSQLFESAHVQTRAGVTFDIACAAGQYKLSRLTAPLITTCYNAAQEDGEGIVKAEAETENEMLCVQQSIAAANRHASAAKAQMQEIVAEVGAAQNRLDSLRE